MKFNINHIMIIIVLVMLFIPIITYMESNSKVEMAKLGYNECVVRTGNSIYVVWKKECGPINEN